MSDQEKTVEKVDANTNADPISGEYGSHPVGTGVGAAGTGIAGAIIGGVIAGPLGAVIGAAVYGVVGGLAGKSFAEEINPTVENEYWQENYSSRSYVDPSIGYDQYKPAYQQGWEAGIRYADKTDKTYDDVEPELQSNWETCNTEPKLSWDKAKPATRDAWDRLQEHRNKYVT